jgi:proline iminopeptidase
MENPDPGIRARTAAEWVTWEDAVISMEHNGTPGLYSNRRDAARLAFVRICAHYFAHGGFLEDGVLIRDAGKLAGIPGILVQGRNDLGGPVITAWELGRLGQAPNSSSSMTPGTPAARPCRKRWIPQGKGSTP